MTVTSSKPLTVIMPSFNEAEKIAANIEETVQTLRSFVDDFEIIVVDDGSRDETSRAALAAAQCYPEVRVLRYDFNMGKGFALACGAHYSRGRYIAFLDSDLDLHPGLLHEMLRIIEHSNASAVVGSKFHPGSHVRGYPFLRRMYSCGYYFLVRTLFNLPLRDTQTGIRVFQRSALKMALEELRTVGFAFDVELLVRLHDHGHAIVDAPIALQFRRAVGRITMRDVIAVAIETFKIFARTGLGIASGAPTLIERLKTTRVRELVALAPVEAVNAGTAPRVSSLVQ